MANITTTKVGPDPLAGRGQLPLHNKRIMVTAPRQYASKLTGLLVDAGARPCWVPGVMISRLDSRAHPTQLEQLDEALLQLPSYTHVAFTSKNGIVSVMERLVDLTGGVRAAAAYVASSGAKLAALGADGQVLEEYGLKADVLPAEASTAGLVKELQEHQQQDQQQTFNILCPVPFVTGGLVEPPVVPRFLAGLQGFGAEVHRVDSYTTSPGVATPQEAAAEKEFLEEGCIGAIAFSSQAEAQGLCFAMGGKDALVAAIERYDVLLAAHGPFTAAGVEQILERPVPCVSRSFGSFQGLVDELGLHLKPQR